MTIYRGLPYDLPAGIRLYETYYVSGVPGVAVPVDRRGTLLNNQLRSQSDATNLIRQLDCENLRVSSAQARSADETPATASWSG